MHRGVLPAWQAFPEAVIPARLPFQDAAGIRYEQRWWDADHGVHRHRHLDVQMVDGIPAVRRVHPDVGAGKLADRALRHPADELPAADAPAAHETADVAGSAQQDSAAAPYKPGAAPFAA